MNNKFLPVTVEDKPFVACYNCVKPHEYTAYNCELTEKRSLIYDYIDQLLPEYKIPVKPRYKGPVKYYHQKFINNDAFRNNKIYETFANPVKNLYDPFMPAKHKYKCLNPNCNGTLFIAMNSPQPTCPKCSCIKVEDWGEPMNIMIGGKGGAAAIDTTLRKQADRYGLTDMSNRDGQSIKQAAKAKGEWTNINVGGIDVPVDNVSTCTRGAVSAPISVGAGQKFEGKPSVGSLVPTRLTHVHNGA